MHTTGQSKSLRLTPLRLVAAGFIVAVLALLGWLIHREKKMDRRIAEALATLRAEGWPVDSAGLARLFPNPPPDRDAELLFTNLLHAVEQNPLPASTPVVITSSSLPHATPFPPLAMQDLRAYVERMREIWSSWPSPWPTGAVFASHWERGMESNTTHNFVRTRRLAQALTVLAMFAAEEQDAERATELIERAGQFASALPSDTLVAHMIRRAVDGLNVAAIERCLHHTSFSDDQLRRLQASLPPLGEQGFARAQFSEHCRAIWFFRELRNGRKPDELISRSFGLTWWERIWRRIKPRFGFYRDEDFLRYLEVYRPSFAFTNTPGTQGLAQAESVWTAYNNGVISEAGHAVVPSYAKALRADFEAESRLVAAHTALAIERYRRAHGGSLPGSIEALVPGHLPALPRDVFDGQPLRFKPLPSGYTLWSVGPDGTDNGGLARTNSVPSYDIPFTVEPTWLR